MIKDYSKIFSWISDINNYENRKVENGRLSNGLTVSTVYTSDEGYETAIISNGEVHPVERYLTREQSEIGHNKWMDFAKTSPNKIIKLGWTGIIQDEEIELTYQT